jgi:hypothetical protein
MIFQMEHGKIHLAVDALGIPVRAVITDSPTVDSSKAVQLIKGIDADCLIAGRRYNTNVIVETAKEVGATEPCIMQKIPLHFLPLSISVYCYLVEIY